MIFITFNNVGILKTNLLARSQAHKLLLGLLHEVIALNPEFAGEFYSVGTISLVLGIVDSGELLNLILRIVGDNHLNRIKNGTNTDGTGVQVIANCTLEQSHIVKGIDLGVSDLVDELNDALGAISTTAEATDGWHTGVIPSINKLLVNQCQQIAL